MKLKANMSHGGNGRRAPSKTMRRASFCLRPPLRKFSGGSTQFGATFAGSVLEETPPTMTEKEDLFKSDEEIQGNELLWHKVERLFC